MGYAAVVEVGVILYCRRDKTIRIEGGDGILKYLNSINQLRLFHYKLYNVVYKREDTKILVHIRRLQLGCT